MSKERGSACVARAAQPTVPHLPNKELRRFVTPIAFLEMYDTVSYTSNEILEFSTA
jgi:hypothetical protein